MQPRILPLHVWTVSCLRLKPWHVSPASLQESPKSHCFWSPLGLITHMIRKPWAFLFIYFLGGIDNFKCLIKTSWQTQVRRGVEEKAQRPVQQEAVKVGKRPVTHNQVGCMSASKRRVSSAHAHWRLVVFTSFNHGILSLFSSTCVSSRRRLFLSGIALKVLGCFWWGEVISLCKIVNCKT